jgi:adenine-specific DNA-methyltransferase
MAKSNVYSKLDQIKDKVGKPYFSSENVLLYNIDCSIFLESLDSNIFDLTITSPPYNIGKEYEKNLKNGDYLKWCEKWLNQIYQSTSSLGSFWLNLGYFEIPERGKCVPISYLLWDKVPFYFLQEIIWYYKAGVATKKYFSPRNEKYMWYVKNPTRYTFNLDDVRDKNVKYPNQKKNGKLKCNPLGKNPTNVWDIPKVTSGKNRSSVERVDHPAQFPLAILDRIIKASSNKKELIFDPFMGSGSVAVSAINNDRIVVGCDINKKYLEIAKTRIKNQE